MSAFTVKIKIDFRGVILFKAARRLETLDMFSTSLTMNVVEMKIAAAPSKRS